MFEVLGWLLFLFLLAMHPVLTLLGVAAVFIVCWIFCKELGRPPGENTMPARTADGRFPILNEDWEGAIVLAIDDEEVPEVIRAHGARFKNLARYAIDLGRGEYLLYGADGELLDMCVLK